MLTTLLRSLALLLTTLWLVAAPAMAQEFTVPPNMTIDEAWTPRVLPDAWIEVDGVAFRAYGHADDAPLLMSLSRHGSVALPRLASELGVGVGGDIHVFLARSHAEFQTLQPGNPPPWADATAYPSTGAIFLRHPSVRGGGASPLEQVLDHELIHVLLGRAFAPVPTPRWLQEGVAQVYSGEAGPDTAQRISSAAVGTKLYSLSALEHGFPQSAHRAGLAYAQTADFVQWMRGQYGDDAIKQLIALTRQGRDLKRAVRVITGESLEEVDAAWGARLETVTRYGNVLSVATIDGVLWGGTGLLMLVFGFARRRQIVTRLREWRDEDTALERLARQVIARRRGDSDETIH